MPDFEFKSLRGGFKVHECRSGKIMDTCKRYMEQVSEVAKFRLSCSKCLVSVGEVIKLMYSFLNVISKQDSRLQIEITCWYLLNLLIINPHADSKKLLFYIY